MIHKALKINDHQNPIHKKATVKEGSFLSLNLLIPLDRIDFCRNLCRNSS